MQHNRNGDFYIHSNRFERRADDVTLVLPLTTLHDAFDDTVINAWVLSKGIEPDDGEPFALPQSGFLLHLDTG